MPLQSLPNDIFTYIFSFLDKNSNHSLTSTGKEILTIGKQTGFLRSLSFTYKTPNYINFVKLFWQHRKTIKSLKIEGIDNPQVWIVDYTENIIFSSCTPEDIIDPPYVTMTKCLRFVDDWKTRMKYRKTLRINWEKFKNVEELYLHVFDVDLKDIKVLKKLKKVYIHTFNSRKKILNVSDLI